MSATDCRGTPRRRAPPPQRTQLAWSRSAILLSVTGRRGSGRGSAARDRSRRWSRPPPRSRPLVTASPTRPATFSPSATMHPPVSVATSMCASGSSSRPSRCIGEDQPALGVGVVYHDGRRRYMVSTSPGACALPDTMNPPSARRWLSRRRAHRLAVTKVAANRRCRAAIRLRRLHGERAGLMGLTTAESSVRSAISHTAPMSRARVLGRPRHAGTMRGGYRGRRGRRRGSPRSRGRRAPRRRVPRVDPSGSTRPGPLPEGQDGVGEEPGVRSFGGSSPSRGPGGESPRAGAAPAAATAS